ncbi:MAG: aldose 1-epimerase family protein [Clostridia bacterium]|nr:aldose 1-epimerase family protein [Clostridia bacterium]
MLYTLKNDSLCVKISSLGAELTSVTKNGCEYIWQGDPDFWEGQAPILFPICGRLFGGSYTYGGKEYQMDLHGFARSSEFSLTKQSDTEIALTLTQSDSTMEIYPFEFELTITYTLSENKLSSFVCIKNTGNAVMPATFGAHPGFNVPLDNGNFDDWYLEFSEDCTPNELVLSSACFCTGKKRPIPLESSRIIRLCHELFDADALFMDRVPNSITLKSQCSNRFVTLDYPGFPYLGLWHKPHSKAPYVCIEPWHGLPSYDGIKDDLEQKNDTFHILPQKTKNISYSITFG